jgi:hypothetical protein
MEENNKRYQKTPIIPHSAEINEHIFGTIKWGYNHFNGTKWGTQFNYAGIQQNADQYTWRLI